MSKKTSKKVAEIYVCEKCDYSTPRKYNYEKHLQTKKHNANNANKMLINANKMLTNEEHICNCGKKYKHFSSFSRHKSNCKIHNNSDLELSKNVHNQILSSIKQFKYTGDDKQVVNFNITTNIQNNTDNSTNKTNSNNTNNTNNSFSVKNYLNNECKDAFTVKQVLDNFQCDIMKLPSKPIPFYKDIVDKAFLNIPTNKLPIRCSDMKRKTFYGNTKDWNKEFNVVEEFIKKLVDAICEFRKAFVNNNPKWIESDITSDIMSSIIMNIAKVYDEHTVNKIIQYISERTKIDK